MTTTELMIKLTDGNDCFYSRDQVVDMLNSLDVYTIETKEKKGKLSKKQMAELAEHLADYCADWDCGDAIIDYDLTMNSREVELESVTFDRDWLEEDLKSKITDFFEE